MDIDPDIVTVFTDGSCYPNNGRGPGGWAFYCTYRDQKAFRYGYRKPTTNNEMELLAILQALRYVPIGPKYDYPFTIYTDSKYAKGCISEWGEKWSKNGWKNSQGKKVKSVGTVKEAIRMFNLHAIHRNISIKWIRGHNGNTYNHLVDVKAGQARSKKITNWKDTDDKLLAI